MTKRANVPFLSLHTLSAARGDGLHPEFVKLFTRLAAGADATLPESAQPPAGFTFEPVREREGPASNKRSHKRAQGDENTDAMSARGQERRYRPRPPTVRCYTDSGHIAAPPRTGAWGQFRTLPRQARQNWRMM